MAFYNLEPWGCAVDDQRAGEVAAATYNVNRPGAPKLLGWDDILVRDQVAHEERKRREVAEGLKAAFAAHNARVAARQESPSP